MKTLKEINVYQKRVILRCDLNVPRDSEGGVLEDFRIKKLIPTIEYLLKNEAKIILLGHFGRPWEEATFPRSVALKKKYSLAPIGEYLSRILNYPVQFLGDCIGEEVERKVSQMRPKEIILLENVRFYREEKENDQEFAKKLADLGEVFVNDAFSASHRNHASIVSIPRYLPSCAGFLMQEEIENLSKIIKNPKKPLIAIIGGVKFETKIGAIIKFLEIADHLLIGGKIANTILAAKGIAIGRFLINPKLEEMASKIELTNPKVHLPLDGKVSLIPIDEEYIHVAAVGKVRREEECFDIGPETIELFSGIIRIAKTIIWNGPLGYFENEKFAQGTHSITEAIVRSKAFSVVGGGDTVAFLHKYGFLDKFNHVSTGGGAMLEFIAKEGNLPGIDVLG
ncbi:MAG: phosphoglycerate kinase [Candidatus Pacebacteria bacterium]|nr:phosphoglycerate kinase [Candidatus Paceibacterota bacterium]